MANCKCKKRSRIVSSVAQNIGCTDVCVNSVCAEPSVLSIMAPLIYDEIGVNLCATFDIGTDIATTYPTVTNASIRVIDMSYFIDTGGVLISRAASRPNCYDITLSNITVTFAMDLYDASCRLVATVYPTAVYLPPITGATYDADTNPSSVELELFAPYGLSYTADTSETPAVYTPTINYVGFVDTNNYLRQGINLYGRAKIIGLSLADNMVSVGLTMVLQSLYFSGYQVKSAGRIDTPKGSILASDNSDCMQFVEGDLLELAIKPLDFDISCSPTQCQPTCQPPVCPPPSCGNNSCATGGCVTNNCANNHCTTNNCTNNNCINNAVDNSQISSV